MKYGEILMAIGATLLVGIIVLKIDELLDLILQYPGETTAISIAVVAICILIHRKDKKGGKG